jgi:hypothetical protein
MAITQTISNLPPAPQSTDPSNFRTKADTFVSALNTFEYELNLAIPQMNALETNVNDKEASATSSALVCTSAANFQGTWTNQTTVIGQSWAYNGLVYLVLVSGNTSPTASPSNWMSLGSIDTQIHSATSKATPVDADEVPIVDSAASFSLKKLTWGNLKATLKTYFDGIYANLSSPSLTGTPTAPTAPSGTNTTQIATTAFVTSSGKVPQNSQTFTSSGTFTVPAGMTSIIVVGSYSGAGGGGGGGNSSGSGGDGGGGGASIFAIPIIMSVSPSQQFTITIGAGGAGGAGGVGNNSGGNGGYGGTTQFGSFNFYNNLGCSGGGGCGGGSYAGGAGGGPAGGAGGNAISGAGSSAGIGYAGYVYTLAGGAAANSSGGGAGGTSNCNNGSVGSTHSGTTGGAGGAGGAGKVIVYW